MNPEENTITLSDENKIWVEKCARGHETNKETFLNFLLSLLRSEFGENPDNVTQWMQRSKNMDKEIVEVLKEASSTRVAVEEAARAVQLYINQIQRERFPSALATFSPSSENSNLQPKPPVTKPTLPAHKLPPQD